MEDLRIIHYQYLQKLHLAFNNHEWGKLRQRDYRWLSLVDNCLQEAENQAYSLTQLEEK